MDIGSWVLKSLPVRNSHHKCLHVKKIIRPHVVNHVYTLAPETFVRHKKNWIKFDFLRFHIHNKHFDIGKDDEYEKRKNAFQNVGLSMQDI